MEQRPEDSQAGDVGQQLQSADGQLQLVVRGIFNYLRSHADYCRCSVDHLAISSSQSKVDRDAYVGSMSRYHLAELNIAIARGDPDSPVMAEFMDALDRINALAESSPGYVWRLQTDEGNATAYRAFDDERTLLNLTVWEDVDGLADFVYRSGHTEIMRGRAKWFERMVEAYLVAWWVPAGHHPTVAEAEERLRHLRANGPTSYAFTLRRSFPPPGESGERDEAVIDDRSACPAGG